MGFGETSAGPAVLTRLPYSAPALVKHFSPKLMNKKHGGLQEGGMICDRLLSLYVWFTLEDLRTSGGGSKTKIQNCIISAIELV